MWDVEDLVKKYYNNRIVNCDNLNEIINYSEGNYSLI